MKRKLALLVLVMLIALATATPALARRGQPSFTIGGYITAIGDNTITVQTVNDRLATVQVTNSTGFFRWTLDGRVSITFGEVEVGDSTNIKGTVDGEIYFASQVMVDVPLNCNP